MVFKSYCEQIYNWKFYFEKNDHPVFCSAEWTRPRRGVLQKMGTFLYVHALTVAGSGIVEGKQITPSPTNVLIAHHKFVLPIYMFLC